VGAERPEAIILVRVHDTQPRVHRRWGMTLEMTSNELFRRVALDAIDVLDLPPLPAPSDAPDEPGTAPSMQPVGPDTAATAEPPPIAAGP